MNHVKTFDIKLNQSKSTKSNKNYNFEVLGETRMDNLVISDLGILETITKKREKRMGTKVKNVGNYDLK